MKLKVFTFIDEVIDYKHQLRFEIREAKQAVDALFLSIFQENDRFVNYTSRIKEDESLKEKIIRHDYGRRFDCPEKLFDSISDILGCRLECRFIDDERLVFEALTHYFPTPCSGGYFRSDRDPRIELRLGEEQPLPEKNGFRSYRLDGRFLGNRVLNFELQIKSIVNLFWNEIDHKILYKNYNYVVSEKFVRAIMNSIRGNLSIIDRQMQMVYDHLRNLDSEGLAEPSEQIRSMIGRILQDAYIVKLRDEEGILLDFRKPMVLITDYLFAKVQYESRADYAAEFVRLMDGALHVNYESMQFGETLTFETPVHYAGEAVKILGNRLEAEVNEGLLWNIIIRIILGLNPHRKPEEEFRTFVDYLYFRIIHVVRQRVRNHVPQEEISSELEVAIAEQWVKALCDDFRPEHFTSQGLLYLQGQLEAQLKAWKQEEISKEALVLFFGDCAHVREESLDEDDH